MSDAQERDIAFKIKKATDELNAHIAQASNHQLRVEVEVIDHEHVLGRRPHLHVKVLRFL